MVWQSMKVADGNNQNQLYFLFLKMLPLLTPVFSGQNYVRRGSKLAGQPISIHAE